MKLEEAKQKYIQAWGSLGTSWGINRAMAQVHALLLISTKPLSTEEIMQELQISRGNANMNIRALMDWGLVNKILMPGERKEYFETGKDVWELAKTVAEQRKKRELEPIIRILSDVNKVEGSGKEEKEFKKVTSDLLEFANQADSVLSLFKKSKSNWLYKALTKLKL